MPVKIICQPQSVMLSRWPSAAGRAGAGEATLPRPGSALGQERFQAHLHDRQVVVDSPALPLSSRPVTFRRAPVTSRPRKPQGSCPDWRTCQGSGPAMHLQKRLDLLAGRGSEDGLPFQAAAIEVTLAVPSRITLTLDRPLTFGGIGVVLAFAITAMSFVTVNLEDMLA
jgi:hypothetical protein